MLYKNNLMNNIMNNNQTINLYNSKVNKVKSLQRKIKKI